MKHLDIKYPHERALRIPMIKPSRSIAAEADGKERVLLKPKVFQTNIERIDYEFPHYRNQR
jgi:hypothetical protein